MRVLTRHESTGRQVKTVRSTLHRKHFPKVELAGGELVRPYECPERWEYIITSLEEHGHHDMLEPQAIDMQVVGKVHGEAYLKFLQIAWQLWEQAGFNGEAIPTVYPARRMQQREPSFIEGKLGYFAMAIETAITPGTWDAAVSSAACAQTAQRLVSNGETMAFALCRPPGHHAGYDLYGGYCFLNNAAIAAQGFIDDGAARVAVLDVDFHHGNGTQDIFYNRADVLFLSLHGDPDNAFPHFLGYADETGTGSGSGLNFNYPLPPGTPYRQWHRALMKALDEIRRFTPDVLVVSLGVDTFEQDPISFFKLGSNDFSHYGAEIARLSLPTVFVMEGGYAVSQIGTNTVNVLNGFLNESRL